MEDIACNQARTWNQSGESKTCSPTDVVMALHWLTEFAVMRWVQDNLHLRIDSKAQVIDNLREWSKSSLPDGFVDEESVRVFCCFSTISEAFINGVFGGQIFMSHQCPSFEHVVQLPPSLRSGLVSVARNSASGTEWTTLFSIHEARDLGLEVPWCKWIEFRQTPSVLERTQVQAEAAESG